jgi:hypothetical protein
VWRTTLAPSPSRTPTPLLVAIPRRQSRTPTNQTCRTRSTSPPDEATNAGKLGGYSDQWFNSNLAKQDAARKIGLGNSNAENLKSLLPAEQGIAQAEAYKPPSPWGQILSGGGSMLGSYSGPNASPNGAQLPFGAGSLFAPTPSSMLGPYSGGD